MTNITIKEGLYEGYIWMSDKSAPKVLNAEAPVLDLDPMVNPFVIEAQLYCESLAISYSIKYVDGEYIVNEYDVNDEGNFELKEYIPARMEGVKKLIFRQYWKEVKEDNCCGWEVLKPGKLVFVGFDKKEDEAC